MEIPVHLMPTFKMLERHGHQLRTRYGPELKRHIKYEDNEKSLVLDVKLPGENEWVRMTPTFVKSLKKETTEKQLERNRTRLSASDEGAPRSSQGGASHSRENQWSELRPRNTNGFTLANRNLQIPTSDNLTRRNQAKKGWGAPDV